MSIIENIVAERLSPKHNVLEFECGVNSLDNFLKNDALIHQKQRISFTTVYLYENQIIGYITLANDSISLVLNDNEIEDLDTRFPQFPALKICRIARHIKFTGCGIGEYMMDDAKAFAHSLNKSDNILGTGCRFITADIRNPALIYNFYIPNEFELHAESDNGVFHYRYDLGSLDE